MAIQSDSAELEAQIAILRETLIYIGNKIQQYAEWCAPESILLRNLAAVARAVTRASKEKIEHGEPS